MGILKERISVDNLNKDLDKIIENVNYRMQNEDCSDGREIAFLAIARLAWQIKKASMITEKALKDINKNFV